MHTMGCTQWDAHDAYDGARTMERYPHNGTHRMKSTRWNLHGIRTMESVMMEPAQWKLHDGTRTMESA